MIDFKCYYCGKKLKIKDIYIGKTVRCPACRHRLFVKHKNKPADSKSRQVEKKLDSYLPKKIKNNFAKEKGFKGVDLNKYSDVQIADMLQMMDVEKKALKPDVTFLLPSYDEITLFILSAAFIFLLGINTRMRAELVFFILNSLTEPRLFIFILGAVLGMILSFLNILNPIFDREKTDFEKKLMLIFAVVVSAGTGIYSAVYMFENQSGWILMFPLFNVINSIILLLYLLAGSIDAESIVNKGFHLKDIIIAFVAVVLILMLCDQIFKMHWVISYSICVCYILNANSVIEHFLGKKNDPSDL